MRQERNRVQGECVEEEMIVTKLRMEFLGADWMKREADPERMSLAELLYHVLMAEVVKG